MGLREAVVGLSTRRRVTVAQAGAALAAGLWCAAGAHAQISLTPGDVAIIGRTNNTTPDVFTFVNLVDLPAGTVIHFTDNGWITAPPGFRGVTDSDADGNENLTKVTLASNVPAGTIFTSGTNTANWAWATSGAIPGGVSGSYQNLSLGQGGEQIYAVQAANVNDPIFTGNNTLQHLFVFDDTNGFESASDSSSGDIPPGLSIAGHTAVTVNFATGGTIAFNTGALVSGTKSDWLTAIANPANWAPALNLPSGNISVVAPTNPSVASVTFASGPDFTGGQSINFTVTLSGAPVTSPATVEINSAAFSAPVTVNISAPNTSGVASATLVNPVSPLVTTASATATANASGGGTSSTFTVYPISGVSLSPSFSSGALVGSHSLTASVLSGPNPAGAGVNVTFQILSGPNAGLMATVPTNGSGQATFMYSSSGVAGQDVIQASGTLGGQPFTATATRNWVDTSPLYLSELLVNAPGADQGSEFVEIMGAPNRPLAGYYLVVIENDFGNAGTVDLIIDLGSYSTGADGLLLIRDTADVLEPAPDANCNVVVFDFTPDIENDGNTYVLGYGQPPTVAVDYDANNDGTLDAGPFAGFTAVDAVAYYNGDNGGLLYADDFGGVNLPQAPADPNTGWTPDQIVRILTPSGSPCIWAASDVGGSFPGPYSIDPGETIGFADVGYTLVAALQMSPGNTNLVSPRINASPSAQSVSSGDSVTFTVSGIATGYQWRRNGMNLSDGGAISGATSSTLTINPVAGGDAGDYDVVLTSPCGSVSTTPVALSVSGGQTPCQKAAAYAGDTHLVEVGDLFAFLDLWFLDFPNGAPTVADPSGDFDGDADVDVSDLFQFLDEWFAAFGNGGTCA